jgi:hypothetical protein
MEIRKQLIWLSFYLEQRAFFFVLYIMTLTIENVIQMNEDQAKKFADSKGYKFTKELSSIDNGASFYEVQPYTSELSSQKKKDNTNTPYFIVTEEKLEPDSLLRFTGGKRKTRRYKKSNKTTKNHRKSNRRCR